MKKAFLHRLPLVLLVSLTTATATLAQGDRGHRFGDAPPARHEMRAYMAAKVLPVLRQQRQKLEAQLAPADQLQLATYRAELKALRGQEQALHQQLHPAGTDSEARPALTDAQQQQVHELHTQRQAIMQQVARLAQKYEANMQQLAAELAPQKTQWATDLQALEQKDATPDQLEKSAHWQSVAGHHSEWGKLLRPSAFLLLEPAAPAETSAVLGGTSVYPNPASATAQLQYDVKKAGSVTVELLDASGNPLRTVVPATTQQTGTYTQALDLSGLPKGTYFYKISTQDGSQTKRLVKE